MLYYVTLESPHMNNMQLIALYTTLKFSIFASCQVNIYYVYSNYRH